MQSVVTGLLVGMRFSLFTPTSLKKPGGVHGSGSISVGYVRVAVAGVELCCIAKMPENHGGREVGGIRFRASITIRGYGTGFADSLLPR